MAGERIGIEALRGVAERLGQEAIAQACGVRQSAVSYCLRRGKRVPAEWCMPIEQLIDGRINELAEARITRHDLRPDLYPREAKAPANPSTQEHAA